MIYAALIFGWLTTNLAILAYAYLRGQAIDRERQELIQRIQAPESASLAYAREQKEEPEPIPTLALDDDEGYEALRLRREGAATD